jgi:hypothetical protein
MLLLDSTRGALRGGRGGSRGGRGGFRGGRVSDGLVAEQSTSTSAWGSTAGEASSSEVPATTDAWASAPTESSNAASAACWASPDSSEPTAPKPSNNDEFAASGGWGDAPTAAETEAAVESAGGWGDKPSAIGDVPPVPKKAPLVSTHGAPPKLSWAQIAR